MAAFTAGMFLSSMIFSFLKISSSSYYKIFKTVAVIHLLGMFFFPFMTNIYFMMFCILLYGVGLGINSTLMLGAIQLAVTDEMRGKVLSLMGALCSGLVPLGMAFGGILGEYIPLSFIISFAFFSIFLCYLLLIVSTDLYKLLTK